MGHGPRYHVPFRRRREGRTDYRKRLALLRSGESRVVVRRGLRTVHVQFVSFDAKGDVVSAQANSRELPTFGWQGFTSNLPAAYLTGLLAGARAKKAGVATGVLDIGPHTAQPGTQIFAALKGVLDAGINVPHSDDVLPATERLKGEHLGKKQGNFDAVITEIGTKHGVSLQFKPTAAPKKKQEKKGAPAPPPKAAGKAPKKEKKKEGEA
ncbi:MAG: 50S ribosomal protein L18 [Methanobacteriota archaeon]